VVAVGVGHDVYLKPEGTEFGTRLGGWPTLGPWQRA
jgi:hypothetical protein